MHDEENPKHEKHNNLTFNVVEFEENSKISTPVCIIFDDLELQEDLLPHKNLFRLITKLLIFLPITSLSEHAFRRDVVFLIESLL